MAIALDVTPAYLSALEHGKRGQLTTPRLHQICAYFDIIWDEADDLRRLADISRPKITIDTAGLSPEATELVNRLAKKIGELNENEIEALLAQLTPTK
jgi:transcriptional regulator with XRE-family HTH domain